MTRKRMRRAPQGSALVSGLLCLFIGVSCTNREGEPTVPSARTVGASVLLVTLDTTRADRLGCYGHPGNLTPNLDRLAERGTLFSRAIAQASVTPVSHASIMTGLYPYRHGLRRMHGKSQNRLEDDHTTLAEMMREANYRTAAFVSAFPVSERFGLAQGFETFDADIGDIPLSKLISDNGTVSTHLSQRTADATTDHALDWLARHAGDPFLLWVHYFDPHDAEMMPPEEYRRSHPVPPESLQDTRSELRAIYDAEVRFMDLHLGRLLDDLERRGLLDAMIVVVVADHGEGLGDHDWWTHGILYQEQIRVPLIVRAPGLRGGQVVDRLVRTVDIVPTVLEMIGVDAHGQPAMDGRSLVPVLGGKAAGPEDDVYSDAVGMLLYNVGAGVSDQKDDELFAVVDWPWKYIHHLNNPTDSELFDLSNDPAEQRNLVRDRQDQVRRLAANLDSRNAVPVEAPDDSGLSQEELKKLEALGYVN